MPHLRRLLVLAVVLPLVGCTATDRLPDPPPPDSDGPELAVAELAAGLTKRDLTEVEFVGLTGVEANQLFQPLVEGMGPRMPEVSVGGVTRQGDSATASLSLTWTFPGVAKNWAYPTEARLTKEGDRWKTNWLPSIVQPDLDGSDRLTQRRLYPARGELLDGNGEAIVELRPVVRIGIDLAAVSRDAAVASATKLARLVGIDAKAYAARVKSAGPSAFVEAIVFRAEAPDRPANKDIFAIKGALPIEDEQMLALTRDFARPVVGTVGEATKEIVDKSEGAVVAGDQVGLSGLQRRYDKQMRGTPGVRVQMVPAKNAGATASPTPSPSASPTTEPVTLFEVEAIDGRPLQSNLIIDLQRLAERTLAKTKPASALVAIQPSTGAVVATANSAGTKGQSLATIGQNAPGSTFKVVSALALLRAGLTPGSRIDCPETITVDGKRFKNYSDYPRSQNGTITLETALAQSCNTAFIGQRGKIKGDALAEAAGSLGVGIDYDVGYSSFFGSVPEDSSATGRAAALIGQGKVEASALAMASVAASVVSGKTVVPALIQGQQPDAKGEPLTKQEAAQLQQMMRAVVTQGSGQVLSPLAPPNVIAKTGTAEYGAKAPYPTHAWMIAAQGDLAVAVFVRDGESGSRTAGPLLRRFLAGAG